MLLECENKGEEFSLVYVKGEGCLSKREGVGDPDGVRGLDEA